MGVLGPSGAGKSTVINALYNDSCSKYDLIKPAKASGGASGETSEVNL